MLKTLIVFLTALFTTISLQAQTVCKGTVLTLNKQPVANASVLIKDSADNILQFLAYKLKAKAVLMLK